MIACLPQVSSCPNGRSRRIVASSAHARQRLRGRCCPQSSAAMRLVHDAARLDTLQKTSGGKCRSRTNGPGRAQRHPPGSVLPGSVRADGSGSTRRVGAQLRKTKLARSCGSAICGKGSQSHTNRAAGAGECTRARHQPLQQRDTEQDNSTSMLSSH